VVPKTPEQIEVSPTAEQAAEERVIDAKEAEALDDNNVLAHLLLDSDSED
jgi:hypothetical protein